MLAVSIGYSPGEVIPGEVSSKLGRAGAGAAGGAGVGDAQESLRISIAWLDGSTLG